MPQPSVRRQHPLFSPLALLGVVVLLGGLGIGVWRSGGQAFSPGELSAVSASGQMAGGLPNHAALGDECLACHAPFAGVVADNCLGCHTAIGAQQAAGAGLHGRLTEQSCVACHQEHQGAAVDLRARALERFSAADHRLFFVLDGAHREVACEGCHGNVRFAGTPRTCDGCHAEPDVHAGQFGRRCTACHVTDGWKAAELRIHPFPIDHGLLGSLECATCHTQSYTLFTCQACHEPGFERRVEEVIDD